MYKKIILACVVVFSAIWFGFSSNRTEAEIFVSSNKSGKCAILPFKDALSAASSVFVGKVKSERKEGDTRIFEFEVEKYWKGAKKKKIQISVYETARYQAWLETGEKYLIFATAGDDGALHVGRCSRSKQAVDASEDLQKLGKGKRPK